MAGEERERQLKDGDRILIKGAHPDSAVQDGEYEVKKEGEEVVAETEGHKLVARTYSMKPVKPTPKSE